MQQDENPSEKETNQETPPPSQIKQNDPPPNDPESKPVALSAEAE